jgi:hypothetical protein
MLDRPIALDNERLEHLKTLAAPLQPHQRARFLNLVADSIRGRPVGPADVFRAAQIA